MYVFKDDRVIEFDGELSSDTLVEFLLDVRTFLLYIPLYIFTVCFEGEIPDLYHFIGAGGPGGNHQ